MKAFILHSQPIQPGRLTGCAVVVLFWLLMQSPGATQELVTTNPYKIEAAFLRNFAHYVTWPKGTFADENAPWCIGILGQDPFSNLLENTLQGRSEKGRPFAIYRADTLDKLPPCQIVFIAYNDPDTRRIALDKLRNKPVLTVGDTPEFLQDGGIIQFQVSDRVEMSINLDQARAASLAIQTKMLEVSSEIMENGVMKRAR